MRTEAKVIAVVVAALCWGCSPGGSSTEASNEVAALKGALDDVKQRVAVLENTAKLESMMNSATASAYLDPMSDGYSTARTDIGPLLISFQSSSAKADGTEVVIQVGNPSAASLAGAKFLVEYNRRQDGSPEWDSSLRRTQYTALSPLVSGAWNNVTIPLAGIKPDELGYLAVRVETNEVRLSSPHR